MAEKDLFITTTQLINIDGNKNIPTVLYYEQDGSIYIGSSAIERANERFKLNEDFKVDLGNIDPTSNVLARQRFKTSKGDLKSAAGLTSDFINELLKGVNKWLDMHGLQKAPRVLLAEPLSMQEDVASPEWLSNYRQNLRRILYGKFDEIEFLPEPFAVFQYYRYGVKHPLISEKTKHMAFVIDFGGGTFDTCVVETTKEGDISMSGKHSKPLGASSRPIGGYYFNRVIAEELLFKYVVKKEHLAKAKTSIGLYKKWRDGIIELDTTNDDHRNFISNYHELIYKVEVPKLILCRSIFNWGLDDPINKSVPIALPTDPFSKSKFVDFNLTAENLRDIFIKRVWQTQLKEIIRKALGRAEQELSNDKISLVLLSGGSSNIRWLLELIKRDFQEELGDAEIIGLHEDFQEVVAKGLAIECARRTYSSDTEFVSVTYNPINLLLKPDEHPCKPKSFKPLSEGIEKQDIEGVLLPSASALSNLLSKPLRWRIKLEHSPKHQLEYYFLRSTYSPEDKENLINIVDHRVYTPKNCKFDSSIQVEIVVKEDGTCIPKFIYKVGPNNSDIHCVIGKPFYIDMTYNQELATAKAYIGLDFGTSNTSISYVDQLSVQSYQKRSSDKLWKTLNELVYSLPYPLANPLAKYLGETRSHNFIVLANEFIEAALALGAYISYLEYCSYLKGSETKIFRGFTQRSAGPLWKLLQESLKGLGKMVDISAPYIELLQNNNNSIINNAVNQLAQYKHKKISETEIDHRRPVEILANISNAIFSNNIFGFFDNCQPIRFGKGFTACFRHAIGNPPFSRLYEYKGNHAFSKEQSFLVNLKSNKALPLQPLIFWDNCNKHPDLDGHCYFYDIQEKENSFSFKAAGYDCLKTVSAGSNEYNLLVDEIKKLKQKDIKFECYNDIELKES